MNGAEDFGHFEYFANLCLGLREWSHCLLKMLDICLENKTHFFCLFLSMSLSPPVEIALAALVAYLDILHWAEHTEICRDLPLLLEYEKYEACADDVSRVGCSFRHSPLHPHI